MLTSCHMGNLVDILAKHLAVASKEHLILLERKSISTVHQAL